LRVDEGVLVPGDLHMPHEHAIFEGDGESYTVGATPPVLL